MATTTIYASASGSMNADSPTTIGTVGTYVATGHFGTPQTNRGLLVFDISSLGADWTINSATLKLTVIGNFLGTSHTLNIYRLKRNWILQGISGAAYTDNPKASHNNYRQDVASAWTTAGAGDTTNDRDATAIGTLSVTSSTSGQVSITLTASLVAEWVSGAFLNNGLVLVASDETNTTLMRWGSPGNATQASRPQLVIDYTPTTPLLSDNMVGYWKMDEASGNLADASGHGHSLVPVNMPTQVSGIISNAQHYVATSSQYHSCSDSGVRMGNTDWTCCGWVKLTDKTDYYAVVSNVNEPANYGWLLFYHKVTVLDYFVFQLYGTTALGGDNPIMDVIGYRGGNPAAGSWVFFACRHDSVRHIGQLFINGNAPDYAISHNTVAGSAFMAYPGTPLVYSGNLDVGGSPSGGAPRWFMNGDIDEVGLWNRWLSNDEISTLYNSGAGARPTFANLFRRTLNMRSASRGVTE